MTNPTENTEPAVSVIMSVYDGERYLARAIESILDQTHTDFEFVIVNDGSTDSSEAIIKSYDDSRIKYLKNPENIGLARSLNVGLQNSIAPLVARQDADDVSYPDRLQNQLNLFANRPEIDGAGTNWKIIDLNDDIVGTIEVPVYQQETESVQAQQYIKPPHGSWLFRRKALLEVDGYDERFRLTQDLDLFFRLIKSGHRLGLVKEVMYEYRVLPEQLKKKLDTQQRFSELAYRRYYSETDEIDVPESLSNPGGRIAETSNQTEPDSSYWYQLALLAAQHGSLLTALKLTLRTLQQPFTISTVKAAVKVPIYMIRRGTRRLFNRTEISRDHNFAR